MSGSESRVPARATSSADIGERQAPNGAVSGPATRRECTKPGGARTSELRWSRLRTPCPSIGARRGLVFLVCASALFLVLAPSAGAYVYWANKYETAIGRARLDGGGANQSFITVAQSGASHPVGLAVDAGHVYWANFEDDDTIGRASLDGRGVDQSFVTGATDPVGVAVDTRHVYWTNKTTGTIGRADLDGSHPDQDFIGGASEPYGLAVDRAHVYWTNRTTGTVGRADLDGSHPDQD